MSLLHENEPVIRPVLDGDALCQAVLAVNHKTFVTAQPQPTIDAFQAGWLWASKGQPQPSGTISEFRRGYESYLAFDHHMRKIGAGLKAGTSAGAINNGEPSKEIDGANGWY